MALRPNVGHGLHIFFFLRFLDHTQRRSIVGRTPLDEWSARRRDLYLTTHNTHNRQTSMPPLGFEPTISASERPQTYALDRAATGTGTTRQVMYVNFDSEARSCNHCCSGKVIIIRIFWLCICSLRYLACNAHAPSCHLRPVRLYNIFFTLSYKWHYFRKTVIGRKMCVLTFSTTTGWNISHSQKK